MNSDKKLSLETDAALSGLKRIRTIWRLSRQERTNPEPFYRLLADEAAAGLQQRYGSLAGSTLLDLGCGPGYYTEALRRRGATIISVDNDPIELGLDGNAPQGALIADAGALPMANASIDGVFCSNLLEHTPTPHAVVLEIERVLRSDGWGYISWTNWYSPWGGHDMIPYQYLGPRYGPRLYERRHGKPRKNAYGTGLWAAHIGATLRFIGERPGLRVERVEPRYWPRLAFICRIPVLREFLTWNCVVYVRKV